MRLLSLRQRNRWVHGLDNRAERGCNVGSYCFAGMNFRLAV